MNTHLESTKDFAAIRQQQLAYLLRLIESIDRQSTIIAAGDFNLRDKEVCFVVEMIVFFFSTNNDDIFSLLKLVIYHRMFKMHGLQLDVVVKLNIHGI